MLAIIAHSRRDEPRASVLFDNVDPALNAPEKCVFDRSRRRWFLYRGTTFEQSKYRDRRESEFKCKFGISRINRFLRGSDSREIAFFALEDRFVEDTPRCQTAVKRYCDRLSRQRDTFHRDARYSRVFLSKSERFIRYDYAFRFLTILHVRAAILRAGKRNDEKKCLKYQFLLKVRARFIVFIRSVIWRQYNAIER